MRAFSVLSEVSVCLNTEFWRRNQGADTLPEYLDIRSPFKGGSRISYSGEFIPPDWNSEEGLFLIEFRTIVTIEFNTIYRDIIDVVIGHGI